jgi:hypothetical protein
MIEQLALDLSIKLNLEFFLINFLRLIVHSLLYILINKTNNMDSKRKSRFEIKQQLGEGSFSILYSYT